MSSLELPPSLTKNWIVENQLEDETIKERIDEYSTRLFYKRDVKRSIRKLIELDAPKEWFNQIMDFPEVLVSNLEPSTYMLISELCRKLKIPFDQIKKKKQSVIDEMDTSKSYLALYVPVAWVPKLDQLAVPEENTKVSSKSKKRSKTTAERKACATASSENPEMTQATVQTTRTTAKSKKNLDVLVTLRRSPREASEKDELAKVVLNGVQIKPTESGSHEQTSSRKPLSKKCQNQLNKTDQRKKLIKK